MSKVYSDDQTFEHVAKIYNEARPGYPDIMYQEIAKHKVFTQESKILEIGCGQGIATEEISKCWNPWIIALEPGENLSKIARKRVHNNPKITIINSKLEDYEAMSQEYDGIFSATAFHWIDNTLKYKKAYELLQDDGLLVVYWNNFGIGDIQLEEELDNLYIKYGFEKNNKSHKEIQYEKIEQRRKEIEESELFKVVDHKIIEHNIEYSVDRYINLLKTFPNHSQMKVPGIEGMFHEIRALIPNKFGMVNVHITVNLEIAQKT